MSYISRHPLAARRPLAAISRYLWWQAASRLKSEIEYDWLTGAKFVAKRGMTGVTGNIYCGLHEFYDMGFLLHFLRAGDLFVDIGANVGSYTVLAAAVCGADVVAVEPDPETAADLARNVKINAVGRQVEIVEAAVGAARGEIRLTVGRGAANQVATGTSSPSRIVELQTLDQILGDRRPAMLKLDVEGYEAEVMLGAAATLASPSLQAIVTESEQDVVRETLEAAGFRVYVYDPFTRAFSKQTRADPDFDNNLLFLKDIDFVKGRIEAAPRRNVAGVEI